LDKVATVRAEREAGVTVMVGDGINDAPALAAADVGVAMGARGATASSEAADIVLVVDRLDRIAEAMSIARRSRRIAVQSVVAGMALSVGAMFLAAFGVLVPVVGAVVQEAIDVAVILNALRALRGDRRAAGRGGPGVLVGERFRVEHQEFVPELAKLRSAADRVAELPPDELRRELDRVRWFLLERLPQHEDEEETVLYPVVEKLMGGEDPMASMARAHQEIDHLSRVFAQLLEDIPPEGPTAEDLMDLRRVLYGLHAILRLHFAQEEEAYAWLASGAEESASVG
jgi:iron-sulfur cluster repair protein YtfE (RIC family)